VRTVEQIQRERGLDIRGIVTDADKLKVCGYNPSKEGEEKHDCGQTARWHAQVHSDRSETGYLTLIACDVHLGIIMTAYGDALTGMHEFIEDCGDPRGWWVDIKEECGSLCLTEQDGIRLGYLAYVTD
jgi:hypothetical protein